MAHQGLLQLQVGRGMFVQKPGCAPKGGLARASVLMLSIRAHSDRNQQVARLLQGQLSLPVPGACRSCTTASTMRSKCCA